MEIVLKIESFGFTLEKFNFREIRVHRSDLFVCHLFFAELFDAVFEDVGRELVFGDFGDLDFFGAVDLKNEVFYKTGPFGP